MLLLSGHSPSASSASSADFASYQCLVVLAAGSVYHIWMGVQTELVALQVALEAFVGIVALAAVEVWPVVGWPVVEDSNVLHLQPK